MDSEVVKCGKCKGSGWVNDYFAAILPPLWVIFRVIDALDPECPVKYTRDRCPRCDGKGLLRVDAGKLRSV